MTKKEFEVLFVEAVNALKRQHFVPYDTGNLKFNAIKWTWSRPNTFTIYIDEKVAPYVYFTNEPWEKRRNPNENWVDKAVKFIATYIATKLGGDKEW